MKSARGLKLFTGGLKNLGCLLEPQFFSVLTQKKNPYICSWDFTKKPFRVVDIGHTGTRRWCFEDADKDKCNFLFC